MMNEDRHDCLKAREHVESLLDLSPRYVLPEVEQIPLFCSSFLL